MILFFKKKNDLSTLMVCGGDYCDGDADYIGVVERSEFMIYEIKRIEFKCWMATRVSLSTAVGPGNLRLAVSYRRMQ